MRAPVNKSASIRAKNVAAFVAAFSGIESRGPTLAEICSCLRIREGQARVALRKLERIGAIKHAVIFEPVQIEAQPQP